jgi:hypothetical protein
VRTLEMTIAARCLQARARAAEVRAADPRYRALIDLFIGGTAALQDAVADLGDSTGADFHAGCDAVTYLRGRGVIAADAPGSQRFADLSITEDFLVAERIRLGDLMDMCATFLDRLEDHYELYADAADEDDDDAGGVDTAQDDTDDDQIAEDEAAGQVPAAVIAQAAPSDPPDLPRTT